MLAGVVTLVGTSDPSGASPLPTAVPCYGPAPRDRLHFCAQAPPRVHGYVCDEFLQLDNRRRVSLEFDSLPSSLPTPRGPGSLLGRRRCRRRRPCCRSWCRLCRSWCRLCRSWCRHCRSHRRSVHSCPQVTNRREVPMSARPSRQPAPDAATELYPSLLPAEDRSSRALVRRPGSLHGPPGGPAVVPGVPGTSAASYSAQPVCSHGALLRRSTRPRAHLHESVRGGAGAQTRRPRRGR